MTRKIKPGHTFHRADFKGKMPTNLPVISGSGKDIDKKRLEWLKKKQKEGRDLIKKMKGKTDLKDIKEMFKGKDDASNK